MGARNRETVRLEDNDESKGLVLLQGDDCEQNEYKHISSEQKYFNSEKGYITKDVILQRISDGSYFKFEAVIAGQGHRESDYRGVEVFPKVIERTVYE